MKPGKRQEKEENTENTENNVNPENQLVDISKKNRPRLFSRDVTPIVKINPISAESEMLNK